MLKKIAIGAAALLGLAAAGLWIAGMGVLGSHEGPGEVTAALRPEAVVTGEQSSHAAAAGALGIARPKQVLFGDLHVHTTFSFDAFLASLPVLHGEGAHPPADACDFARFCSSLDFWSINDHAEQITPRHWRETVDSIRRCNDVSGEGESPDTVAFLGWEWTQVGQTPDDHYGHKNVVLAGTDEASVPKRPIAAGSVVRRAAAVIPGPLLRGVFALMGDDRVRDLTTYFAERARLDLCATDVPSPELPEECLETAEKPAELFRKLDEWGMEAMVIPHGTTWGFYTPPGSTWDKQLVGDMHDPERQTLLEIYSGHGDSDVYRDWREVELDADGVAHCPEPRPSYLPTCWRAGEIIRERCLAEGSDAAECEQRAVTARANAAAAGGQAHLTVPGATLEDWLDAGQCRDCAQPAFNYRPGGSAQYILGLGGFDADPANPRRFRFGFISSSDNHSARPGTGYKEVNRLGFTESGVRRAAGLGPFASVVRPGGEEPVAESRPFDAASGPVRGFALFELERQASFFMTGGLVAVHSEGRDRRAIWDALQRKEVYGTSGPRMLLWFDLLNPPAARRGAAAPMGSEVAMDQAPIFQVRAVGSFEQRPGCPDYATQALGPERIEHVCKGECYNPSDARRPITRIEVIRIRPLERPDEKMAQAIQDPWRRFECEPDPAGCVVTFSDADFPGDARDSVYYVRAYEPPAPGINAAGLRCTTDAEGNCIAVDGCGLDPEDDCLAEHEPRAWSSPIFVDFAPL